MKARAKSPAKTTAKNQRPSRGSWKRLEVNIQIAGSKLDELKQLAEVSKLGWHNYVEDALCCYAGAVEDRMQDEQQEAAEARLKKEGGTSLVHEQTKPTVQPSPGLEDAGVEARMALCGVELKALEQWSGEFCKRATIHNVAHFAMLFALTNPKKFQDWLGNMASYCEAEDMEQQVYLRSRLAALYSTKKLKIA